MNLHVTDEVADFVNARLPEGRMQAVREHLAECAECAAEFRWAEELRDRLDAEGLRHLPAERIVEAAERGVEILTDAERRHLAACGACEQELEWARRAPSVEDARQAAEDPARGERPSKIRPFPAWAWVPLAAAAGLVLFLALPRSTRDGEDLAALAHLEPIPVRMVRSTPIDEFERNRVLGLDRYADGAWGAAREALTRASDERPDAFDVTLYLGSAAILQGDVPEGTRLLQRVAEQADAPALREEALWVLAQSALQRGEEREARRVLRAVEEAGGDRAPAARSLLARIDALR